MRPPTDVVQGTRMLDHVDPIVRHWEERKKEEGVLSVSPSVLSLSMKKKGGNIFKKKMHRHTVVGRWGEGIYICVYC